MRIKALGATLALVSAIAACGSGQSPPPPVTVTVPAPVGTGTTSVATTPQPTTTRTTTAPGTTSTPPPTRTATTPAFVNPTGGTPAGGDLPAAVSRLRGLGFAPVSTGTYDPSQTLRVLVGTRGGTRAQQAFFFDGARYLGTDATATSGRIDIVGRGDTEVTVRYAIYRPSDRDCCPSGAPRSVVFALDSGRLVAQGAIPSVTLRR